VAKHSAAFQPYFISYSEPKVVIVSCQVWRSCIIVIQKPSNPQNIMLYYSTILKCSKHTSKYIILILVYLSLREAWFDCTYFDETWYTNKTKKSVQRYINLLHYKHCIPLTSFGHLPWPFSGWCFYEGYIIKTTKPVYKYKMLFISVINQLDAQNFFCFTISLFHASTCFKHMCSKHVEAWNKLILRQNLLCIKLLNYWDKYTEMHGQQNVKKKKKCYVSNMWFTINIEM